MKTSPLHLMRARGLLLAQPLVFSVQSGPGGSRGSRPTFLIKIMRPDAPLRLLPRLANAMRAALGPAAGRRGSAA